MRRDGHQHGTIRYHPSPKPTHHHSRFSGKCHHPGCTRCHHLPLSKSKDKCKGSRKLRSFDVSVNPRLVSWRVVDSGSGAGIASCVGASASSVLGYLEGYLADNYDDCDGDDREQSFDEVATGDMNEGEEIGGVDGSDEIEEMGFCCVGVVWDCMDEDDDWCVVGED